jgi:serine/threonine protein kinase
VLAQELLDAISYIHRAGIIHRDIKPANVLIGADGRARLTDFGIAQPSGATRITSTGQVIGTHRYIAPEILLGHPANERSDLYALGVLLGECLRPGTSRQLQRLVGRLTESDPHRRPSSAADAIALLQAPATTTTRTATLAATIVAAAVLVLALILLATGGGNSNAPEASKLAAPAPSAPLSQQLAHLDRAIDQSRR